MFFKTCTRNRDPRYPPFEKSTTSASPLPARQEHPPLHTYFEHDHQAERIQQRKWSIGWPMKFGVSFAQPQASFPSAGRKNSLNDSTSR